MSKSTLDIVIACAEEINAELEDKIEVEQGEAAALFGDEGVLDSVGLVSLVVSVEQAIEDELGHSLSLADEKAISQKNSPFLTIGALASYADSLIQEQ